jgi:hypothetical protein
VLVEQPDLYLARALLEKLTGTVQPKRMCAWLAKNLWVFVPSARRGHIPTVARAYHDAQMSGQNPAAATARRRRPTTDWMTKPNAWCCPRQIETPAGPPRLELRSPC